jgi:hypothetical protein
VGSGTGTPPGNIWDTSITSAMDFNAIHSWVSRVTVVSPSNADSKEDAGLGPNLISLLCKYNLWIKNKNILMTKKIDIFIYNLNKETPLSYISKENYNEFIDIITLSYYNNLKKKPNIWISKWENDCSNIKDKNTCLKSIKDHIIKNNFSIPLKKKHANYKHN